LYLTPQQERAYRGEMGEALQFAMQILVEVGDAFGADRLVPIRSAHVLAHYSSLHEAGIELLEELVRRGGRFAVPTTVNPASIDLENWREFGIPEDYAEKQFRLCRAFLKLGGIPCWSCTQYQFCNIPRPGEVLAWAESNAVVYANSVLGCRTNRIGAGLDVACAITGLTPRFGMLVDENRRAQIAFRIRVPHMSDLDYASVGYLIGKVAGARVPALEGLPHDVTGDQLKHLGAGAAAAGPVAMIHFVGITPGSDSLKKASKGSRLELVDIERKDLEQVEGELNQTDETPDLVALGVPHLSIQELITLSQSLTGKRLKRGIEMWIYVSPHTYELAERSGIKGEIERTGARLTHSTDAEVSPLRKLGFEVLMTNSSKLAAYASSEGELKVRYASLEKILQEVMV
jgi:predicted aconitase